ncbi:MAG: RNA polymerase sigma factor [Arenimonas sp.]
MNTEDLQQVARADELLAIRCQLGERAAFDQLIRQWAPPLRKYVQRVTNNHDASDDIMQEIWISVVRGVAGLQDCSKLRSWLFSIAHRTLMDRLRGQYSISIDNNIELDEIVVENLEARRDEARQIVESGLSSLPLLEREVISLFYLQELSLVEIATALTVPIGTIKSRLFRARIMLRDQIAH